MLGRIRRHSASVPPRRPRRDSAGSGGGSGSGTGNGAGREARGGDSAADRGAVVDNAPDGWPLTWLVDGQPVTQTPRRQAAWVPNGAGFARISVLDATGASDSVSIRLE